MLWIAALVVLASAIQVARNGLGILRSQQTYLLIGLTGAVGLSHLVHLWLGGALTALLLFIPTAIVYFMVVVNVTTWRRMRILAFAIVACALLLLAQAIPAYFAPYSPDQPESTFVLHQNVWSSGDLEHLDRLRSVGFLNDPNDFAQFLITTLPLVFIAWRPQSGARNLCFVLLPSAVILWGMYLTHSRGGLLGLMVLFLFMLRDRFGTIGSAATTIAAFAGLTAMQFTGNRGISMEEGTGRIEAWSAGLGMFKSSPLFGVGFGKFPDLHEITAHNSFILCLAELGLFGLFFWISLLSVSALQLNELTEEDPYFQPRGQLEDNAEAVVSTSNVPTHSNYLSMGMTQVASTPVIISSTDDKAEEALTARRWAKAIRLSLFTFIVTAWFLSRTYVVTLYLYLGLTVALTGLIEESGVEISRYRTQWRAVTLVAMFVVVVSLYVIVRLHWA
jgi:hypothetical protein